MNSVTFAEHVAEPGNDEPKLAKRSSGQHVHINKARVRKLALAICANDIRHRKFNRIGESFYDAIEAAVRSAVAGRVKQQPSVGKTLT